MWLRADRWKAAGWVVGGTAGLFVAANVASSLYFQHRFLRPARKLNNTSDLNGYVPEAKYTTTKLEMRSTDGLRISALLLTPEKENGHAVIVCHGLRHDKNSGIRFVQYLLNEGYRLLLIDFRNHGESEGRITTYGYYEKNDLLAAIKYLRESLGASGKIAILGASMGASIALMAAAETKDLHALILDSPFASLREITFEWAIQMTRLPKFVLLLPMNLAYLWLLIFTRCSVPEVEPWEKAKQIKCPLFLIHGGADKMIPPHHSRRIFESACGQKEIWIIDRAEHLGVYIADQTEYQRRVLHFLRKNLIECA
jgi:pimeloyl-ACP methyl ester carboxylesterase